MSDPAIDALRLGKKREDLWLRYIKRATCRLNLAHKQSALLNRLLLGHGLNEWLPLANTHVRVAARTAMIHTLCDFHSSDPERQSYLITFKGIRGVTTLEEPEMNLVSFQTAIDKRLRDNNLSGLGVFEFDVLRRDGALDTTLLFHAHVVAWPMDGAVQLQRLTAKLASSRAFPSWNQAPGVHITPIVRKAKDVARVGGYMLKPFHDLKRRYPDRNDGGRTKLRSTLTGLTGNLVLRTAQLQSMISVRDAVFGVGQIGTQLRAEWWQQVRDRQLREHRGSGSLGPGPAIDKLWSAVWLDRNKLDFANPAIITRSSRYRQSR